MGSPNPDSIDITWSFLKLKILKLSYVFQILEKQPKITNWCYENSSLLNRGTQFYSFKISFTHLGFRRYLPPYFYSKLMCTQILCALLIFIQCFTWLRAHEMSLALQGMHENVVTKFSNRRCISQGKIIAQKIWGRRKNSNKDTELWEKFDVLNQSILILQQ